MAARISRLRDNVNWLGLAVIVAALAMWQGLVSAGVVHAHSLPGPDGIWLGVRSLEETGDLWPALGHTVKSVLIAWALAVAAGGFLGLLLGLNRTLGWWTSATVDVFRSLPVIAFVPIAILVWGPGSKAEIIVAGYAALWPMLMNTAGGVRTIGPRLSDVARTLRLSRARTLWKVMMPATGAAMIVGARISLGLALIVCVVTEMLGTPFGLGHGLTFEQTADQPGRVWAYILLVGVLGLVLNGALVAATRLAFPGISLVAGQEER